MYYYPLIETTVANEINKQTVSGMDTVTVGNGQVYFNPNFVATDTQHHNAVDYGKIPYYESYDVQVFFRVTSKNESRDGLESAEVLLEFNDPFVFKTDSLYTVSLRVGSGSGKQYNKENPITNALIELDDDNANTEEVSMWNEATPTSTNVHQVTNFTFTQKQMSTLDNISRVRIQYDFDHAIDDNVQCIWFSYYMRIEQTSEEIVAAKQSTGILGNKIDQSTNIIKGHIDDATDKIMGGIEDSTNEIKGEIQEGTNQIVGEIQDSTDEITGEIQEGTDQITDKIDEQTEKQKGFFENLLDGIINGLKALFIPGDVVDPETGEEVSYFSMYFDDWNTWMEDHFGVLYFPFQVFFDLLDKIVNFTPPENPSITFPGLSIMGQSLLKPIHYDFAVIPIPWLQGVHDLYLFAVDAIIGFWLVRLAYKKLQEIMGGGS